jgi:hypothetical protein
MSNKLAAGISMLADASGDTFASVKLTLDKVLGNVQANPSELKYRRIRRSNARVAELLATFGVRAVLVGAGFVDDGEFFTLPQNDSLEGVVAALAALEAHRPRTAWQAAFRSRNPCPNALLSASHHT